MYPGFSGKVDDKNATRETVKHYWLELFALHRERYADVYRRKYRIILCAADRINAAQSSTQCRRSSRQLAVIFIAYRRDAARQRDRLSGNIFPFTRTLRAIKMRARSSVTRPRCLPLRIVLNILSPSSDCSYVREFRASGPSASELRAENTRHVISALSP